MRSQPRQNTPMLVKKRDPVRKEESDGDVRKLQMDRAKKLKSMFEQQVSTLNEEIASLQKTERHKTTHITKVGVPQSKSVERHRRVIDTSVDQSQRKGANNISAVSKKERETGTSDENTRIKNIVHLPESNNSPEPDTTDGLIEAAVDRNCVPRVGGQRLYVKMEKKYYENIVNPELEKRKEALKQKRSLYKPIERDEITQHAARYNEALQKQRMHRAIAKMEQESDHPPTKIIKTPLMQKVLDYEEEEKTKEEKRANERKVLLTKQSLYGKLVKEIYFPKEEGEQANYNTFKPKSKDFQKVMPLPMRYGNQADFTVDNRENTKEIQSANPFTRQPVNYLARGRI